MINVKINNITHQLPLACNIEQALAIYGLSEKVFAVSLNGQVIPRAQYKQSLLDNNSIIDVIIPMQGG